MLSLPFFTAVSLPQPEENRINTSRKMEDWEIAFSIF
jgi:hypothetical protein